MDNEDKLILTQLKSGDIEAYQLLFKKYYKLLNIQAFYLLQDGMEAEDAVQQLLIDFWERRFYEKIDVSIKAYLQTSLRNNCLKLIDKKKNDSKRLNLLSYSTDDDQMDEALEVDELIEKINKMIDLFPEKRRLVFKLVHIERKKYSVAAEELGISVNSIKTHLKYAMKSLRQQFGLLK